MMTILDEVLRQCGFIGTLILGGPDPDAPNNIMSMIFHSGKTATGLGFSDAYPDLKATLTSSFNTFAHKCLSKFSCAFVLKWILTDYRSYRVSYISSAGGETRHRQFEHKH